MAERNERGVALLVVLLTVALLTIAVMEFTFSSQVDYRRAVHWVQARQARLVADSGVAVASEILSRAQYLYALQFLDQAQILEEGMEAARKEADGLPELWAQLCEAVEGNECPQKNLAATCRSPAFGGEDSIFEADEASLAVQIDDEEGRYDLNRLVGATNEEKEKFRRLLAAVKVDTAIVEPIEMWTDKRSRGVTFSHGEETGFFDDREIRYPGRGAAFETFRELALVKGVSPEDMAKLRPYVTVTDRPGRPLVNLNTAPLEVLAAMSPTLSNQALLARIHQARCLKPFEDKEEVRDLLQEEMPNGFDKLFDLRSERFRIRATGAVGDAVQSVEAVVRREYPEPGVLSAQWKIELLYYLPRRGPNLLGVDMTENASLNELRLSVPSSDGGFL